jgi:murein DD-endopeptidase MepM/ murein hydrolase activator NlpD/urea transporter
MSVLLRMVLRYVSTVLEELALGYAWIALVPSWRAGLLLAAFTFVQPAIGAVGFAGALSAWYAAQLAGADALERPVCVFNGLLSALFVAHVWAIGPSVLALALMGGVLSGWLTVVLGRLAWAQVQLPILSLPFAVTAMLVSAAAGSLSTLHFQSYVAPLAYFGPAIDSFLKTFGNLYFMSDPIIGALVLLVLLAFSRYYLGIALLGYGVAWAWLDFLGAAPEHLASTAWDSNAILAALLVGGLFSTPSWLTAALALLAAVFAAWLSLALGRIAHFAQLVPFSVPFVLASWLVLYAAVRNTAMASYFNLALPDFPERTYVRSQISRARMGKPGSVPLGLPFMGVWTVSQGFSGEHTHRGPWRHALDFIVLKGGKSFTNRGNRLEDFFCYNLPVLSPAYGQVWRVVSEVPDNAPGTVNLGDNWGNYVIIRLENGKFVMVAHLKPGSVRLGIGVWVKPGDLIGRCGNSGRSPQPHIHLHLQTTAELGSPTAPFHLCSVMVTEPGRTERHALAIVPGKGSHLVAALEGDARPFYLLAGRGVRYAVTCNEEAQADWSLCCEIDVQGRMALVSSLGGRCLVESTWAVFSCYERNGVVDPYLDLWLLACGYSPASTQAQRWEDACIPARMLPGRLAGWLSVLAWPWTAFVHGSYQRGWDLQAQAWSQTAQHRQAVSGLSAQTRALIVPQRGCILVTAIAGRNRFSLRATSAFQRADMGVPAWEAPLASQSS